MSKYGVSSGPYFPAFELNTSLNVSPYSVQMREDTDQKKLRIWTLFTQLKAIFKEILMLCRSNNYSFATRFRETHGLMYKKSKPGFLNNSIRVHFYKAENWHALSYEQYFSRHFRNTFRIF